MNNKKVLLVSFVIMLIFSITISLLVSTESHVSAQSNTQWEYKTVVVSGFMQGPFGAAGVGNPAETEIDTGIYVVEDGEPEVISSLNNLGADGWEMVGFTHNYGEIGAVMIFKRPIQ